MKIEFLDIIDHFDILCEFQLVQRALRYDADGWVIHWSSETIVGEGQKKMVIGCLSQWSWLVEKKVCYGI